MIQQPPLGREHGGGNGGAMRLGPLGIADELHHELLKQRLGSGRERSSPYSCSARRR